MAAESLLSVGLPEDRNTKNEIAMHSFATVQHLVEKQQVLLQRREEESDALLALSHQSVREKEARNQGLRDRILKTIEEIRRIEG